MVWNSIVTHARNDPLPLCSTNRIFFGYCCCFAQHLCRWTSENRFANMLWRNKKKKNNSSDYDCREKKWFAGSAQINRRTFSNVTDHFTPVVIHSKMLSFCQKLKACSRVSQSAKAHYFSCLFIFLRCSCVYKYKQLGTQRKRI